MIVIFVFACFKTIADLTRALPVKSQNLFKPGQKTASSEETVFFVEYVTAFLYWIRDDVFIYIFFCVFESFDWSDRLQITDIVISFSDALIYVKDGAKNYDFNIFINILQGVLINMGDQ